MIKPLWKWSITVIALKYQHSSPPLFGCDYWLICSHFSSNVNNIVWAFDTLFQSLSQLSFKKFSWPSRLLFMKMMQLYYELCNIMLKATKEHVILRNVAVLSWICDNRELVQHVTFMGYHQINIAILTMWCVRVRVLNSLVDYFNVKTDDTWEGNMTTRR
jgi:hypothetical protein